MIKELSKYIYDGNLYIENSIFNKNISSIIKIYDYLLECVEYHSLMCGNVWNNSIIDMSDVREIVEHIIESDDIIQKLSKEMGNCLEYQNYNNLATKVLNDLNPSYESEHDVNYKFKFFDECRRIIKIKNYDGDFMQLETIHEIKECKSIYINMNDGIGIVKVDDVENFVKSQGFKNRREIIKMKIYKKVW